MQIFRKLFLPKCEECGAVITDGGYPGLGPGVMCENCHRKRVAAHERDRLTRALNFSQQVLDRINKDFPPENVAEVIAALTEYGKGRHEYDPLSMRLAILRLANGDKGKIPQLVRLAKEDYRNIYGEVQDKYGRDWEKEFVGQPLS